MSRWKRIIAREEINLIPRHKARYIFSEIAEADSAPEHFHKLHRNKHGKRGKKCHECGNKKLRESFFGDYLCQTRYDKRKRSGYHDA